MESNVGLKFNNKYSLKLVDSKTGRVRQSGDFHNICIKGFCTMLTTTSGFTTSEIDANGQRHAILDALYVGSGTREPAKTDTGLVSTLWSAQKDTGSYSREWLNDYTVRVSATYTFPATSSYVGNVNEVGLMCADGWTGSSLVTRALLTDSEGQRITFEKTDTDILIVSVTVELSIASFDSSFTVTKRCKLLNTITASTKTSGRKTWSDTNGYPNLCRFTEDVENSLTYNIYGVDRPIGTMTNVYARNNGNEDCYVRIPKIRLAADKQTTEAYYRYVTFPSVGYWDLTNSTTFPVYTMQDIPIGTGDGSTTVFTNPLSYFKEDTEVIYKNGVPLTRGVDYTINHKSNVNALPEIEEMIHDRPFYTSNLDRTKYAEAMIVKPFDVFSASLRRTVKDSLEQPFAIGFNSDNPLLIDYEEPVTLNCLRVPSLGYMSTYRNYVETLSGNYTFYVDYSTDGETYTELGSIQASALNGFTMDFPNTTATNWRIRTSLTPGSYLSAWACRPRTSDATGEDYLYNDMLFLTYKDPDITFTTAPAEGDKLTMNVGMDRIMKNSNFVVDFECKVNFTY